MTDENALTLPEVLERAQEKFQKIGPKLDFVSERSFAMQLLLNNDYLKKVALGNPLSLEAALVNVAAIGLSLNPAKKQAYLIPRNMKQMVQGKEQWISKIFLEPSYMGLCDLATQSGSIKWVQANLVHASDTYTDNGPGEKPTHVYNAFAKPEERGDIIGAYCVAKTADGDYLTCTMAMHELLEIRDKSEQWKKNQSGPWKDHFGEQVKKTVIRRAFKTWPKTDTLERMAMAVQLSNENEGFEPILTSPSLGNYTADQKAYFDQLISTSDKVGMFLFTKSIDEATYTNLYHSFEKGQKGRYQAVVKSLTEEGAAILRDVTDAVIEAAEQGHHLAILEVLEGLPADAIEYVKDNCKAAHVTEINAALASATAGEG